MNEMQNKSGLEEQNKNLTKEEMFVRIKELQKLPDEVIEKFLQSKGKLSASGFQIQPFQV
ncbi:MAG: hypothetical protein HYZ10_03010 [Ignavibacteriales bacterium]|nr:hypothetical protein [Ignavibacteriales bacterium]